MIVPANVAVGELGNFEIREFTKLRVEVGANCSGHRNGSIEYFR